MDELLRASDSDRQRFPTDIMQCQKLQLTGLVTAGLLHEIHDPIGYVSLYLGVLRKKMRAVRRWIAAADRAMRPSMVAAARRLRGRADLDGVEEALKNSLGGMERIGRIIQNFREFVRPETAERKPVDLASILNSSLRMCRTEIRDKAQVHRKFASRPKVLGSAGQLTQVFLNLLVNGAQAIEGRGHIHLSLEVRGGQAVLRIRDTGQGMTPEVRATLFTPFHSTKSAGQGLGLYLANRIVEDHGGRIEVRSEPGRGTEFSVRLPLASRSYLSR